MKTKKLKQAISTPTFFTHQVQKIFNKEKSEHINVALSRMTKRKDLVRIKRELFQFPEQNIDEFSIANLIYKPSYVSMESALHIYGIIPEEVIQVTSISPTTTKKINTSKGIYLYSKINPSLFFGFTKIKDSYTNTLFYNLAIPEKALLDYIYIRQIKDISFRRLDLTKVNSKKLNKFSKEFPLWVKKTIKDLI